MKRKIFTLIVMTVLVALVAAGCSMRNHNTTPSNTPTQRPSTTSAAPGSSAVPGASNAPGGTGVAGTTTGPNGTMIPDVSADPDAMTTENMNDTTAAQAITGEVDKLSEVASSQAIVVGDTVVVAVKFDSQYQGGMTDRVREMIEEKVQGVRQGSTQIYITDDETQSTKIGELVTRTGEDIRSDLMDLVDDIKSAL